MSQTNNIVNIIVNINEWNTSAVKYREPKINDKGGKSVNIISTQSNRALQISTPLMMTWGISDFVDEKTGESDGKYSMSLVFPNEDNKTPDSSTSTFLKKLKDFEEQILKDAVKNSDAWFGEELSREVVERTFVPFLKYTKDKVTKKIDHTKSPSIRARILKYNNKWGVKVYDTTSTLLFPCDNENMTPMDFVPKMSQVATVLECGGLWFGGKGWGITWKVNQCFVKPQENFFISVEGSNEEPVVNTTVDEEPVVNTTVDDSDEEPVPKKKIIKNFAAVTEEQVPKMKIIKKFVAVTAVTAVTEESAPEYDAPFAEESATVEDSNEEPVVNTIEYKDEEQVPKIIKKVHVAAITEEFAPEYDAPEYDAAEYLAEYLAEYEAPEYDAGAVPDVAKDDAGAGAVSDVPDVPDVPDLKFCSCS